MSSNSVLGAAGAPKLSKLHYVNVGPGGTFAKSGAYASTPADVAAVLAELKLQDVRKLVIHFHGGLVGEAQGMAIAAGLAPVYEAAGAYPLFFVWETGFLETVKSNGASFLGTELFKKIFDTVAKYVGKYVEVEGSRGGGSVGDPAKLEYFLDTDAFSGPFDGKGGRSPAEPDDMIAADIEEEVKGDLAADEEFRALLVKEGGALKQDYAPDTAGSRGFFVTAGFAMGIGKIVVNIIRRYGAKTDHGFRCTVVEEIASVLFVDSFGAAVWGGMKQLAKGMWLDNFTRSGIERHAGRELLEAIAGYAEAVPDLTIDLVAHSAGSIAVCEMFKAAALANFRLPVRNIVFLAPACTLDLFNETLVKNPSWYTDFRLFIMSDRDECGDALLTPFYTRSLLYLVSGSLEGKPDTPLLGLARHVEGIGHSSDPSVASVRQFLYGGSPIRLALSKTVDAAEGFRCGSLTHGGFDEDEAMLATLRHIITA